MVYCGKFFKLLLKSLDTGGIFKCLKKNVDFNKLKTTQKFLFFNAVLNTNFFN